MLSRFRRRYGPAGKASAGKRIASAGELAQGGARLSTMTGGDLDRPRIKFGPDLEQEARDWLVLMNSGEVSESERASFARWHSDPDHAAAYAEAEYAFDLMLHSVDAPDNVVPLRLAKRRAANWVREAAAIAASVAVFGLATQQYLTVWQYDHATQGSAIEHAELADGSRVELNLASAVDINYSQGQRRVALAKGEAFFDVKRDTARPFIVSAAGGEVRVLGTAFSVKREGDGARVTVTRGKVRVESGGRQVDLTPDQQVMFGNGSDMQVARVDAEKALAWSRGQLVFTNRPLAEVLQEIDRYYPGIIMLRDDAAGRQHINATVNIDRIDEWASTIGQSQGIDVRRVPGLLILG